MMTTLSTILAFTLSVAPGPVGDHEMWAGRCAEARAYSDARRGTSLLVVAGGKVVCTAPLDGTPQELWSGTKSIVTLLAAMAVDDGLITLDEPVSNTITEWRGDPAKAGITVRQLLTMTSGIPSQVGMPPSYADSLNVSPRYPAGIRFLYGPAPYQAFGELFRRKLAALPEPQSIQAYASRRLFDPLEITSAKWRSGQDGNPLMPQGISLTATDWAKLGALVLGEGSINNKGLLSHAVLSDMFKGSNSNAAYGVGWWLPRQTTSDDAITATFDLPKHSTTVPRDLVAAAGAGGQRLYVIPSRKLVIVRQASLDLSALRRGNEESGPRWSDAAFLALLLSKK